MAKHLEGKDIDEFLDSVDTFIFDCDGVLWTGNIQLPHAEETLQFLRSKGKRILFVTNNSTKSRAQYHKKFEQVGITASLDEIFSSSYCAAYFLRHTLNFEKKVYLIGMNGIEVELDMVGVKHTSTEEDRVPIGPDDFHNHVTLDPEVGAVLIGFDLYFNYTKLAKAKLHLADPNCLFLATNDDSTYPAAKGMILPGTGSMVAALERASHRKARVLGKPHSTMLQCILDKYHLPKERTCMVGDRLDTDISFGHEGGLKTLCVLTGVTSRAELEDPNHPIKPDFYIDQISKLLHK
eukprot:Colp12_sorted_trinity150504_noHs@11160